MVQKKWSKKMVPKNGPKNMVPKKWSKKMVQKNGPKNCPVHILPYAHITAFWYRTHLTSKGRCQAYSLIRW